MNPNGNAAERPHGERSDEPLEIGDDAPTQCLHCGEPRDPLDLGSCVYCGHDPLLVKGSSQCPACAVPQFDPSCMGPAQEKALVALWERNNDQLAKLILSIKTLEDVYASYCRKQQDNDAPLESRVVGNLLMSWVKGRLVGRPIVLIV